MVELVRTPSAAISKIQTVPEAAEFIRHAKAAKAAAKKIGMDRGRQNEYAEAALRGMRHAGELLIGMSERGERRTKGKCPSVGHLPSLDDLAITRNQAWRWMKIARLPESAFESYIAEIKDSPDGELTSAGAVELWKDLRAEAIGKERERLVNQHEASAVVEEADMASWLEFPHGADAIITDPPYGEKHLPLLATLAAKAPRALKPDGILAVMFGNGFLPDVYSIMSRCALPYLWTMAYLIPGKHGIQWASRASNGWKPVLLYGRAQRQFHDVVDSPAPEKGAHEWQQSIGGMTTLVERLTEPDQLVLDPFAGSGTTALACLSTKRRFKGCDLDGDAVLTANRRIAEASDGR